MPPHHPKWKFYPMRISLLALVVALLSACGFVGFPGVYKINVEQGNIVTQEMADQLKPGMNRRQVKFILGTPLIEDTFNSDRWDYVYTLLHGDGKTDRHHLTLTFDGDQLVGLAGDYMPAGARAGATTSN